jgi:hypothetical protein
MMKNNKTISQQRVLVRQFQAMVEARSVGHDGDKSYGYQAGYYIGFLMSLAHIPEVQTALLADIDCWERSQASLKIETVTA